MSVSGPRQTPKRTPTVLVTDAREQRSSTSSSSSSSAGASRPKPQRAGTRLISVDNVLQYASEIPSAQRRVPPPGQARPAVHTRTPSGRHPLDPKLRGVGAAGGGVLGVSGGGRTSKTSEKLVLLPETTEEDGGGDGAEGGEKEGFNAEDEEAAPPSDVALTRRRAMGPGAGKTDAERLPKSQRTAEARVTAYCTAQSYKLRGTAQFVREQHGAKTKLYDDCLYCVYQLPLLGGSEGYRVRSSPVVKNPGGRSVLDEQIEANERREYREGWHEESDEYSVRANEGSGYMGNPPTPPESSHAREHDLIPQGEQNTEMSEQQQHPTNGYPHEGEGRRRESNTSSAGWSTHSPSQPFISPDAHTVAELFIFSYGVAVLWNFTPNQEKDLLADLTFSSTSHTNWQHHTPGQARTNSKNIPVSSKLAALAPSPTSLPLMTRPLDEDDFETEEFHFQYDARIEKPRIYNDMITLRTSDHMIKLAMSHAIGQSTKLSFFEERMQRTMAEAQYVPRRLALEGRLGMNRKEVVSLVGRLFEGRVDVNLCKSAPLINPAQPHMPCPSPFYLKNTDIGLRDTQPLTCLTRPTSSGTRNPPSTPSTKPSANTSKSNPVSKSSTSAAASSSTSRKSCQTVSPTSK